MSFQSQLLHAFSLVWGSEQSRIWGKTSRRRKTAAHRSTRIESLEPRLLLTVFQDFDTVTAPALPGGWTTSTTGDVSNAWVTVNGGSVTAPNRVFIPDVSSVSDTSLTSPSFVLAATNRRLIFEQSFNLDFDGTQYFDGGVLEISVAGGAFQDIVAGGGSFVSGGYNGSISPGGNTPLPNRQAWSGNSNGYFTTTVDLPASAIGQNVTLRWRLGTDNVVGFDGWSIDSIRLTDIPVNSINETFDGVTTPALPAGWTTSATGSFPQSWVTVSGGSDTSPNHLFIADTAHTAGASIDNLFDSQITSPTVAITAINSRLTFRHAYNLDTAVGVFFDGGVLEISVDAGTFTDILAAGGTFVTGGYNGTIFVGGGTPLANRQAWSGNSNGYITTTVDLPASAIGHNVQFRWRFATDNEIGAVGWSVDSVQTIDADPDNTIAEASPVALNSSVNGNIDNPFDVDLYAFTVVAGQTIKFDVDAIGAGSSADTFLRIFDATGAQLAVNDNSNGPAPEGNGSEAFRSFTFATAGTYYVGISSSGNQTYNASTGAGIAAGSSPGTYTLHIGPAPSVTITMADTALTAGETSLVTITFSEAVSGFANADLTVDNGMLSTVSSGNGGVTWTATFTPTAGVTDATNLITIDNTLYTDVAGNAGTGTTSSPNYTIDVVRPTVTITMADTALTAGETSLVTFTFSEAVSGFANADLTVDNGMLSTVSSGDGGVTWTATFTPTAGVTDATNLITLNNTQYTDVSGNAGTGTTSSPNYTIVSNLPPTNITLSNSTIAENVAITVVGTLGAVDPNSGDTFTFAILPGGNENLFTILGNQLRTAANGLNFEALANGQATVNLRVTDSTNLTFDKSFTITATDVNEAPVVTPATFSIAENSAANAAVGTVAVNDPDAGQTKTFSITNGNTGGPFAINQTTGAITVASPSALNFETTQSFTLTVQATDNGNPALSGTATITVNVTNVNEAPVVTPASFSIAENSAANTAVGTVVANDPDAGQTKTFSITAGNTGSAFAINPSTGAITVATPSAVNFEANPSTFTLTVRATDNGSPSTFGTATVTINVNNVNEAPLVTAATFTIAENSAASTTVGTVAANDPDAGQTKNFSITAGNTGGVFGINPNTGAITVALAALDFETTSQYQLTVRATDNGNPALFGTATITINVTNVNDAPRLVEAATAPAFVLKTKTPVKPFPSITVNDPDGNTTLAFVTVTVQIPTGSKNLDIVSFNPAGVGTVSDTIVSGQRQIRLTLGNGVTATQVETFLKSITFASKGASLKTTTRQFTVSVTDKSGGVSNVITQNVTLRKK